MFEAPWQKAFTQPDDPSIAIWRYVDLAKYADMLQKKALYFSRADKLGDPFEGSLTKKQYEDLKHQAKTHVEKHGLSPKEAANHFESMICIPRRFRQNTFVSCWHMNEGESEAMWKIYGESKLSIAIKSTYATLEKILDDARCASGGLILGPALGRVTYGGHEEDKTIFHHRQELIGSMMRKRWAFRHEEECRAVMWMEDSVPPSDGRPLDEMPPTHPSGIDFPVPLEKLVSEVVISPLAPEWFLPVVEKLTDKYEFAFSVRPSALKADPYL